jgi:hypothetical protein
MTQKSEQPVVSRLALAARTAWLRALGAIAKPHPRPRPREPILENYFLLICALRSGIGGAHDTWEEFF